MPTAPAPFTLASCASLEKVHAAHAKLQEVLDSDAAPEQFRSLIAALLPEYTPWVSQPGQTAAFSPLAQADPARVAAQRSADTPSANGI